MASRTGRQYQRYIQGCRQVVGCIPYRIRTPNKLSSINEVPNEDVEVLLISSQKSPRLMFPKGGWETDESMKDAARRETIEEAGVDGIVGSKLGKWSFMSKSQGTCHDGHMFALLVTRQLDDWPEQNVRQRVWMSINEAKEVCVHWWMKEALDKFVSQLVSLTRKDEGNPPPCSLLPPSRLYWPTDKSPPLKAGSSGIVAQSGEEDVECCLVS